MPSLPPVEQSFTADASGYLAGIEEMMAVADEFIVKNRDVIASIGEMQTAIDGLHGKDIQITLNEDEVLEQVAYIREIIDDGIPDSKDQCPNEAGSTTKEPLGCPEPCSPIRGVEHSP